MNVQPSNPSGRRQILSQIGTFSLVGNVQLNPRTTAKELVKKMLAETGRRGTIHSKTTPVPPCTKSFLWEEEAITSKPP